MARSQVTLDIEDLYRTHYPLVLSPLERGNLDLSHSINIPIL